MAKFTIMVLFGAMLLFVGVTNAVAQQTKAADMFKNHVNKVVQKVKKANKPQKKRTILNTSFDKMLKAFDKVGKIRMLSQSDQVAINRLSNNIEQKKYELNGTHGFKRVPNNQLNDFANYVQQNIEQANTITISITVLLLVIVLIVLLVAL